MKFDHPLLLECSAFLFASGMRALFRSLRIEMHSESGLNPYKPSGDTLHIYSVWHDSVIMPVFGGKHVRTSGLVSQHRDGAFVTRVLRRVNMPTIRGSSGRTGGEALRELLETAKRNDIVITPDGPRGPRRQISKGIVFLASRSGNPIVPTAFSCSRFWRIKGSWTDLIVPRPFATVHLVVGTPIPVPPRLNRLEFANQTAAVQAAMDRLETQAQQLVDGGKAAADTLRLSSAA